MLYKFSILTFMGLYGILATTPLKALETKIPESLKEKIHLTSQEILNHKDIEKLFTTKIVTHKDEYNQLNQVASALEDRFVKLAILLEDAGEFLGFDKSFQKKHWEDLVGKDPLDNSQDDLLFYPPFLFLALTSSISTEDLSMVEKSLSNASRPFRENLIKIIGQSAESHGTYFANDFSSDLMTLYKDYECLLPHMVKHFQKLGDIFKVIKKEIENSMEDFEHIGKDIWEALTKKIY